MYNLVDTSGNRVTNLQLTRETACKVFTGAITKWNDPLLVRDNPQLSGVSRDIVPIIRADGAGESYVLSEFCIAVEPDIWNAFIASQSNNHNNGPDFTGGKPVSNWPQNWGRSNPVAYADGTANTVADPTTGKDAITYVAAGYAKVRNFPVASLQNAAGVFTQPDEGNVTVALGYAKGNGDGTFTLDFTGADQRSYFPSTYSYILAQTAGFDAGKGATLGQFLCYAVSKGQEIAPQLRYARLSQPLVDLAIAQIGKIPGAPAKDSCFIAGAAAPPPPPSVAPGSATPPPTNAATGGGGSTGTGAGGATGTTGASGSSTAMGGAGASGAVGATPCKKTTTSTTTTVPAPSTTTSSTTTTTTAASGSTTTSTTTTTVPCTAASGAAGGTSSGGGTLSDGSVDLQLAGSNVPNQSGSGSTNTLWVLAAGAGLCALGTTALDWRRGARG
jgi:ABC-type phosphate transport system substrate-binding protein